MLNYLKLWNASEIGNSKDVLNIIKLIDNVNAPDSRGWNAIILASFNHHLEVVKILLENGADINSCNVNGTTVFMYAKTKVVENDNFYFLDYLINCGADINRRDKKKNWTVLDYVKGSGNVRLINYLESKGAK